MPHARPRTRRASPKRRRAHIRTTAAPVYFVPDLLVPVSASEAARRISEMRAVYSSVLSASAISKLGEVLAELRDERQTARW